MDIESIEENIAKVKAGDLEAFSLIVDETLVMLRAYIGFFLRGTRRLVWRPERRVPGTEDDGRGPSPRPCCLECVRMRRRRQGRTHGLRSGGEARDRGAR